MEERGLSGVVPFRFACHRCARCCTAGAGRVWLEDGEIPALARELSMSEARFAERFVRRVDGRLALREVSSRASGDRCALLLGANTCSVYTSRPAHCRTFPYWPSVLEDPAAFERARATCPGIAVVVPEVRRERAFARLIELYEEADRAVDEPCATVEEADVFVTGLEADFWAEHSAARCKPLALRMRGCASELAESLFQRLRAIEREADYPPSYGRLGDMMRARRSSAS